MNRYLASFKPLYKRLSKFKLEISLIIIALIITTISFVIFINSNQEQENPDSIEYQSQKNLISRTIYVDISGSIANPGVYESTTSSRLKDVISLAGGLSDQADKGYFARNYNLARIVSDQEKIYIPSKQEVDSGIYIESQKTIDYTAPTVQQTNPPPSSSISKISLNSSTLEELDTLPGIGRATAQKIIQNRPFTSVDELLKKKIVKTNIFETIKDLVTTTQ